MKIKSGSALQVRLHWDNETVIDVGRLAYRDRRAYLQYDEAFLRQGYELSPVHHRTEPGLLEPHDGSVFEGLHGLFADSLPDGWGRLLLDRRARTLGIEPASLTPLDRLACVGASTMGALTYAPEISVWGAGEDTLDLDRLAEQSQRMLTGQTAELLDTLGKVGGSPAGARPKALIAVNAAGGAIQGEGVHEEGYTALMVKFAGAGDPPDIAAIEYAYSQMAGAAGIEMAPCRLLESVSGQRFFATERFDRRGAERLHVHSASGLLYADIKIPALDYEDLIALTALVTRDRRDRVKMFRLAVFNVLAHNRDDHARQFSFLMDRQGVWRLAPAYDLTFMEGPGGEHATSVLGHGREITRDQLAALGLKADLSREEALHIIEEVRAAVRDWETFARACEVSNSSREFIKARLQAIAP